MQSLPNQPLMSKIYKKAYHLNLPNSTTVTLSLRHMTGSCCDSGRYIVAECGRWWYQCPDWGLKVFIYFLLFMLFLCFLCIYIYGLYSVHGFLKAFPLYHNWVKLLILYIITGFNSLSSILYLGLILHPLYYIWV